MLTGKEGIVVRQRGFTLIEMAVAMAVLALITLLAMPSIGRWLDNARIRNAAESLQSGLQTARMEAVRRNQTVSFYLVSLSDPSKLDNSCALSSSSGSWVVAGSSPAGACGGASVLAGRPIGDAGGRVQVSAGHSDNTTDKTVIGTATNMATFDGFGRLSSPSTALNRIRVTGLTTGTNYLDLMLIVDASGGVRMCDPRSSIDANDPRKC